MKKTIITFASLGLLIACGYKGALYLPKNPPKPSNPANNQYTPQIESQAPEASTPTRLESVTTSNIQK